MDLQLKYKLIVITGGANGIGRASGKALAAEGALVVLIDRDREGLEETIKAIIKEGGKAVPMIAELTNRQDCNSIISQVVEKWGRIDGLVNNTEVNDDLGLESGNPEDFMASLHKNLTHYHMMAHYALPELKKSKGAIVNIGSKVSLRGKGGTSVYPDANGGRNALTREWAVELLPYGIRVNSVIVAECLSPLYDDKRITGFKYPDSKSNQKNGRVSPERPLSATKAIADCVTFLLSPRSAHTTGQLLYVDGGYTHPDRPITQS